MDTLIKPEKVHDLSKNDFTTLIIQVLDEQAPPQKDLFKNLLHYVNEILDREDPVVRPRGYGEKPGGLLNISQFRHTVILPDLHARRYFLKAVLLWELYEGQTIIDMLENGDFNLLCLGDGVHSEGDLALRWIAAYQEFMTGYKKHEQIDLEIADSFNLMIAVMLLKIRYGKRFNFLKGNHENICNETGGGNYAFAKFANEGAMVYEYFKKFYGNDVLKNYYQFEKKLPLFVIGFSFLASHAEPALFFDTTRIINYHNDGELIESLTWTDNYAAEKGLVDKFIEKYLNTTKECFYFGGHRPIKGLYNKINNDRYVQIHNPYKKIAVVLDGERPIDLDHDIVEVPDPEDGEELSTIVEETDIDFSEHFEE